MCLAMMWSGATEQHTSPSHLGSQYYLLLIFKTHQPKAPVLVGLEISLLLSCFFPQTYTNHPHVRSWAHVETSEIHKVRCVKIRVFGFMSHQLWCCRWWVVTARGSSPYLSVIKYLLLLCLCVLVPLILSLAYTVSALCTGRCFFCQLLFSGKTCTKVLTVSFNTHQHCGLLEMHRCTS